MPDEQNRRAAHAALSALDPLQIANSDRAGGLIVWGPLWVTPSALVEPLSGSQKVFRTVQSCAQRYRFVLYLAGAFTVLPRSLAALLLGL